MIWMPKKDSKIYFFKEDTNHNIGNQKQIELWIEKNSCSIQSSTFEFKYYFLLRYVFVKNESNLPQS